MAVYGVPSGMVPTTRSWIARTTSTASWASLGGAERGHREEAAGAREPAPDVAAVAGVLGDRRHRLRLEGLEQDGPQPADVHRGVAVDARDRAAGREPARPRRAVDPVAVHRPLRVRRPGRRWRRSAGHGCSPRAPSLGDGIPARRPRRRAGTARPGTPRPRPATAARPSLSRAASHIRRCRWPMWWSWATVIAKSARPVSATGSAGVAVGVVRARAGGRRRPARTRRRPSRARGDGSAGPALSKSMTQRPPSAVRRRLSDQRSRWQVCTRAIGVRIDSTSSRPGSTSRQAVGVRRPGAARGLEHGPPLALPDGRLEPLVHRRPPRPGRTACSAGEQRPDRRRVERGSGSARSTQRVGLQLLPADLDDEAARPPRAAAPGSGSRPRQQAAWKRRRRSASASSSASNGSNDSLTAHAPRSVTSRRTCPSSPRATGSLSDSARPRPNASATACASRVIRSGYSRRRPRRDAGRWADAADRRRLPRARAQLALALPARENAE